MTLPDPVSLAVPFFVLAILLEVLLAKFRGMGQAYELRDTAASLLMGLGNFAQGLALGSVLYATTAWAYRFHLFEIGYGWWVFLVIFFAEDLCYYWFHRLSHEHRVWWAAHVNHHSSQHYNLSTALRQTWTGNIALTWVVWLPLALIGFPPALIAFQKGISLVYQFWIHTEQVGRMPKLFEAFFNTPSHHRVHHATNPRYLDRNYAGILIIWDKLFGTFVPEAAEDPCRYGISRNLGTFNPLRIAFHEWQAMVRDLARAGTWRERAMVLLGPPGWTADGSGHTSAEIRARWRAEQAAAGNGAEAVPAAVTAER